MHTLYFILFSLFFLFGCLFFLALSQIFDVSSRKKKNVYLLLINKNDRINMHMPLYIVLSIIREHMHTPISRPGSFGKVYFYC